MRAFLTDIAILAELTFREARRRKIVWAALGLGLAFIILYGIGFYFIYRDFQQYSRGKSLALDSSMNFVIMAGMYVVNFLGVMLAVLTSVGSLPVEISSQTIQSLAVKPVRRSAILLGKWLGLAGMLAVYIALLTGGLIGVTWAISRYAPPNALLGVALIIFQAIIVLSLSLLGGTRLSTIANGVVAFMLYGLAFIGAWIERVGSIAGNDTAVDIGIITSLLVPSEAMWQMASYNMQAPAIRMLGMSPFTAGSPPSPAMLIYTLIYTVALIGLSVYSFGRRDL